MKLTCVLPLLKWTFLRLLWAFFPLRSMNMCSPWIGPTYFPCWDNKDHPSVSAALNMSPPPSLATLGLSQPHPYGHDFTTRTDCCSSLLMLKVCSRRSTAFQLQDGSFLFSCKFWKIRTMYETWWWGSYSSPGWYFITLQKHESHQAFLVSSSSKIFVHLK